MDIKLTDYRCNHIIKDVVLNNGTDRLDHGVIKLNYDKISYDD